MSDKKTVLLIDDEVDLVEMLKFQLNKKGYHVVTALDGLEGLERLKTVHPDLIILDVNMPRMNGIEFYNQICDAENKPKYPIFVLTARANLENLFKDLDVKGFMSKPFEVHRLIEDIDKILASGSLNPPAEVTHSNQILIVESDANKLKEIAWVFLDEGFRVDTAPNGAKAVEHIKESIPDVVLINWVLADIPGDMLALKMHRSLRVHKVIFIIYTGKSTDNLAIMNEIRKQTAMHRLVESDRPRELLDAVKEFIKTSNK